MEEIEHKKTIKNLHKIPTEIITMVSNWCVIIALIISYVPMHNWLLSKYFWPIWLLGAVLSGVEIIMTKNKISGATGLAILIFTLIKYL